MTEWSSNQEASIPTGEPSVRAREIADGRVGGSGDRQGRREGQEDDDEWAAWEMAPVR